MTKQKQPLSGPALSSLYPEPKTQEVRFAEEDALEQRQRQRIPKGRIATANAWLAVALFLILSSGTLLWSLVESAGAMSGVFIFFLLGACVGGIIIWQCRRLYRYFIQRGMPGAWYIWCHIMAGFATRWLYEDVARQPSAWALLGMVVLYYAAITTLGYGIVFLRQRKRIDL